METFVSCLFLYFFLVSSPKIIFSLSYEELSKCSLKYDALGDYSNADTQARVTVARDSLSSLYTPGDGLISPKKLSWHENLSGDLINQGKLTQILEKEAAGRFSTQTGSVAIYQHLTLLNCLQLPIPYEEGISASRTSLEFCVFKLTAYDAAVHMMNLHIFAPVNVLLSA